MIDALFNQPGYLAARKMLDASVLRHQAIASNLANLETPNYQRLDINPDFKAELSRAVSSHDAGQIQSVSPSLAIDRTAVAANRDGNTVSLEHELLQMNQNQLLHTLETQLITGSLLKLRLAITGRPA